MMNNINKIILFTILLVIFVPQVVDASSYRQNKEQLSKGKSDVYESFINALPVETSPAKGKNVNEDYSDLISKYKTNLSSDTIKNISDLFPVIESEQVKSFAEMDQDELLNKVRSELSDKEIINILVARSNRISKAKNEWLASLNRYPQTVYLEDLLSIYQPLSEGMTIGTGTEYQQDMIQMHDQPSGMLALRGKIVDADVKMAWLDYIKESRDAIADARSLLAVIQKGEEMISINKESASLLATLRDVARVQYEAGTRTFSDVVRLDTELAARRDEVNRMTSMQDGSISKLLSMLDFPVNAKIGKIQWTINESPDVDINRLRDELPKTRQELQKLALQVDKMDSMIQMTKIQAAPDKTSGFSYFQGRNVMSLDSQAEKGDMSGMKSDGQMEMTKDDFMNKPMVDYRQSNYALDASWATELVNERDAMSEMFKSDINMDCGMLEMFYKDYSQMVKSEKLYKQDIIPKARAALDVVKKGYTSDENDFSDLISSELAYLMARMDLSNASYERRTALIELERTYGMSLNSGKKMQGTSNTGGNE